LHEIGYHATTDEHGAYTIEEVPPGTYTVRVRLSGYAPVTRREVQVEAGQRAKLDVTLVPERSQPAVEEKQIRTESHSAIPPPPPAEVDAMPSADMAASYVGSSMNRSAPVANRQHRLPPGYNTEDYDAIEENTFRAATAHPLSTFSIDVDAASYTNIRRFIQGQQQAPPKDAVRIEEMVNYFVYDYPDPVGDDPFAVYTEVGAAPWNSAHQLVHIGLQGQQIPESDRPASNLVFLLDVSGSMGTPNKLPLLQKAFKLLTNELGADDRVAIVVYAGAAGLVLPSTPGSAKDSLRSAIEALRAGGSTAGSAGIRLAYQVAQEHFIEGGNNRVVLATDGDFNVGVSSDAELVRLIEEKREEGTSLTVLGFGSGNLKDNKMEKLANHGNGNYYYIDSELEAQKVLVRELGGTLYTIAKDVKIQVEFNPAHVFAYRLIGYENRMLQAEDFADDTKDAGELGAGHTVTALYEVIPVGAETDTEVRDAGDLKYQQRDLTDAAASSDLMTVKMRYKQPDGDTSQLIEQPLAAPEDPVELASTSDAFRFAAAVAGFGMVLRDSEHRGTATPEQVLTLAEGALGDDAEGYRAGFLELVRAYRGLVSESETPSASR
jgi:Ca-activated chloride channel family protein